MCFYSKITQDALTVANRFKARFEDEGRYSPREIVNAFEHSANPVITNDNPQLIRYFNWGIIPEGSSDFSIRKYTLNARIESLANTRSFKDLITYRCLVPADGFYEWKRITDESGRVLKERYLITEESGELFAFAGLWCQWKRGAETISTYTICTTEANELMSEIHNTNRRMPVILKKEDENRWLSGSKVDVFAYPYSVNLKAERM